MFAAFPDGQNVRVGVKYGLIVGAGVCFIIAALFATGVIHAG